MNFVNRDIEIKIFEINKKRESLIKKVEHMIAAGELSVNNIRQKMQKTQMEINQQKEISYDILSNNEEKVKTFLNLQQQAAEVMAAVAIWELELNDVELELGNVNKNGKLCIKEQISPLYKAVGRRHDKSTVFESRISSSSSSNNAGGTMAAYA
ncbi:PREDICTED: uncharacterized protein LOC105155055 [Acromyrmex echinatior]|uniref:uncharacterized protein LOC105155055 n=1 Tax=Acromyrmex echinatior TaxID=103372 RepID=UPI000580F3E9|nr:PREDICTED: uncharacterized protein LOC105155055 [Acromyrmex echinatior]